MLPPCSLLTITAMPSTLTKLSGAASELSTPKSVHVEHETTRASEGAKHLLHAGPRHAPGQHLLVKGARLGGAVEEQGHAERPAIVQGGRACSWQAGAACCRPHACPRHQRYDWAIMYERAAMCEWLCKSRHFPTASAVICRLRSIASNRVLCS